MVQVINAFVTLFAILDALGNAPVFLSLTTDFTPTARRAVARRASIYSTVLLLFFSAAGRQIFAFFGVTLPAFRVAGGLILLKVAFDMLEVREPRMKSTDEEAAAAREKQDVSLVPLAVPMLAGPGAISAVLVLSETAQGIAGVAMLWAVIVTNGLFVYLVFRAAEPIIAAARETGMRLVARIMGLILASMAVQFILSGVREFLRF